MPRNDGLIKTAGILSLILCVSSAICAVTNFMWGFSIYQTAKETGSADSGELTMLIACFVIGILITAYQFWCGLIAVKREFTKKSLPAGIVLLVLEVLYFVLMLFRTVMMRVEVSAALSAAVAVLYIIGSRKKTAEAEDMEK
ncbi:MAG: hypothetical protein ACOX6J_05705 [Oscillospiraceae bacterium]|jgi:hypothetical protein